MKRIAIILLLLAATASAQVYSADGHWADSMNVLRNYKVIDGQPRVSVMPYYQSIAEGDVPLHSPMRDIGYNATVGTSEEAVWFTSTVPNWITVAAGTQLACSSSSNSDRAGQIGAVRVIIEYLENDFTPKNDTVVLTGVTRVLTGSNKIYRINDLWVDSSGTNRAAVGNISVYKAAGDTIYRQIAAGRNRTQAMLYTVPKAKTFYMTEWWASSQSTASPANGTEFRIRATLDPGGTMRAASRLFYHHDALVVTNGAITVHLDIPHKYPAGCDIFMGAMATANTTTTQGGWSGWTE
jgi:hypothetical protein